MPVSFWFIKSAHVVLEVRKEWRGSWWDHIKLQHLLKSVHIQVFCYYQLGVSMLPELQINVRSWRVRSTFREVFFIYLNEFSLVLWAEHRHLSAGRLCSSTDLQRTQFILARDFAKFSSSLARSQLLAKIFLSYVQFLLPGNEGLTCRHTHFMP